MEKLLIVVILTVAAGAAEKLASAGTIEFSIANESAPINGVVGGTGSFDLVISDNGTDAIGEFQVDLYLSPGATQIAFTSATFGAAYVFNNNSQFQTTAMAPFFNNIEAFQSDATNSGTVTLSATQLDLLHVTYTVPAGTPAGAYALTFNQDDPATDPFSDFTSPTNTSEVSTSPGLAPSGAIYVTPEPSSALLLLLATASLVGFSRLRSRRL